jgi:hypothetical protein
MQKKKTHTHTHCVNPYENTHSHISFHKFHIHLFKLIPQYLFTKLLHNYNKKMGHSNFFSNKYNKNDTTQRGSTPPIYTWVLLIFHIFPHLIFQNQLIPISFTNHLLIANHSPIILSLRTN